MEINRKGAPVARDGLSALNASEYLVRQAYDGPLAGHEGTNVRKVADKANLFQVHTLTAGVGPSDEGYVLLVGQQRVVTCFIEN